MGTETAKKIDYEIVISPKSGWQLVDLRELYSFRDLLFILVWRDIKVRYKQTYLGVAWAVIQPLVSTIVFAFIFGKLTPKIDTGNFPYQLYLLSGLVPWTFFANSVNQSSNSLLAQQNLITKVYFPRLILPISAVITGLVDLLINISVLTISLFYFKVSFTFNILFLPLLILLSVLSAASVGVFLSALIVIFRDLKHIIPFGLQIWMYVTPIIYSKSLIPEEYRWVIYLNFMSGIVDAYRACFLGTTVDFRLLLISIVASCSLLVIGIFYFKRVETLFADIA